MRALDDLDDGALGHALLQVVHARSAKAASQTSKRWLALCKNAWRHRGVEQCALLGARGEAADESVKKWQPSLACEMEYFESSVAHDQADGWEEHKERVCQLPFVLGLTPAPSAAMWALTKPTRRGAEQVFFDDAGEARRDMWGCNESVCDYSCDSNWNRGFIWGLMAFQADKENEVGYYSLKDRPDDDLDPRAVVAQYALSVEDVDMAVLDHKAALYNSGLGGAPKGYCIGGRLLRMRATLGSTRRSLAPAPVPPPAPAAALPPQGT